MRQRLAKQQAQQRPNSDSPIRRDSLTKQLSAWEISSDDTGETSMHGSGISATAAAAAVAAATAVGVPMYNPLLYQSAVSGPPGPSSSPSVDTGHSVSWEKVMAAKQVNSALMVDDDIAGVGGDGRRPVGSMALSASTLSAHTIHQGGFIGLRSKKHLPSLTHAFIPDARYQAYKQGLHYQSKKDKSMFDKICMAKFCAFFSMIGVMFMVFVGILIDFQPMFIPGILPKHVQYTTGDKKPQIFYAIPTSDRLDPASHAYRAALMYFVTAILCLGYAYNAFPGGYWFKTRWQHYHDIPDAADSTVPTFHNGSSSGFDVGPDGLLPTTSSTANNHQACRNYDRRLVAVWSTVKRFGIYVASIWPAYQDHRRNRKRFSGAKDV
jgi:hypothetical protein